jgi:hypothetical protein
VTSAQASGASHPTVSRFYEPDFRKSLSCPRFVL